MSQKTLINATTTTSQSAMIIYKIKYYDNTFKLFGATFMRKNTYANHFLISLVLVQYTVGFINGGIREATINIAFLSVKVRI